MAQYLEHFPHNLEGLGFGSSQTHEKKLNGCGSTPIIAATEVGESGSLEQTD